MAPIADINYLAVLGAAVASMILGSIWYSPMLFGNLWMKLSKMNSKDKKKAQQKGMGKLYFTSFITVLITSFVLANFVDFLQAGTIVEGMQVGFMVWFGFVATMLLNNVIWGKESIKAYFLNAGFHLVSLVLMSSILTIWV